MNPNDMSNPNSILFQSVMQSSIYSSTNDQSSAQVGIIDPVVANHNSLVRFGDDISEILIIGTIILLLFLIIFRWIISAFNRLNL